MDANPRTPNHRAMEAWIVAALCGCFAFLVISGMRTNSPTYDETWHLATGYTEWLWNDYRMSPDHPPLIRKLVAFPLRFMRVWPSRADWAGSGESLTLQKIRTAWALGFARPEAWKAFDHYLFYGIRDDSLRQFGVDNPLLVPTTVKLDQRVFYNDSDRLIFWARLPVLLLGLLLGVLVFCWAREWCGLAGGVLALALYCFDPNFVAHSGLVTADVGVTTFLFGAVYFFWRTCRHCSAANVALTGLCSGLAIASKVSAVLLVPFLAVLALVRIFSREKWAAGAGAALATPGRRLAAMAAVTAVVGLLAYGIIWAVYDFRYSAAENPELAAKGESIVLGNAGLSDPAYPTRKPGCFPIEDNVRRAAAVHRLLQQWPSESPDVAIEEAEIERTMGTVPLGWNGRLVLFIADHHLLPEAFVYGTTGFSAYRRISFLRGDHSKNGFRDYFLWSFLLKTPIVTLAAVAIALVVVARRRGLWLNATFLLVPALLYFVVAVASRVNVGHRHLLPIYPFLFVLCGVLAREWDRWQPRVRRWTAAAALGAIAVNSLVVFAPPWRPALVFTHQLSYFNELAGGPRNGYRYLVDSNFDWGQDLKNLKRWTEQHGVTEPINLCYFGTGDPRYYQLPVINLPGTYEYARQEPFERARVPGLLAISATNLEGAYFGKEGRELWRRFLEHATLIDRAGYSILIYRLDAPVAPTGSP